MDIKDIKKKNDELQQDDQQFSRARYTDLKESVTLQGWPEVRGYDFNQPFDFEKFLNAYNTTGFQATNLGEAIEIVKQMRKEKATIFLGFTSNMASCGVREIIAYLTQHKLVDVLCTSAGGVEEDIIKSLKPFVLGDFNASGKMLREKGVNRTGNIFIPNDRYIQWDKMMQSFLKKLHDKQKQTNTIINCEDFCSELGKEVHDEHSFVYWAAKNKIPLFCPSLTDGSIGDMIYFYKYQNRDFKIDITDGMVNIVNLALHAEKVGIIILGGGVAKHFVANACLFREGADYAVYINTGYEGEGSNAGANPDEAVPWGKISDKARAVKVWGEASIIFPLLVAGAFIEEKK